MPDARGRILDRIVQRRERPGALAGHDLNAAPVQLSTAPAGDSAHHQAMSNNILRARLVLCWCMFVMTIGAWSVVTGSELTLLNAARLCGVCVLPPLAILLSWRRRVPVVIGITSFLVASLSLEAQSSSGYRQFELGASVASISTLAGGGQAEPQTLHSRPAVIQELRWRRPYSAPADTVQQIVFSFYDDQLSKMVVDYDRDRTLGLTDADLIDALSVPYGPPSKAASADRSAMAPELERDSATVVARWIDADRSIVLYRSAYSVGFRLIVASPRLEGLARTAAVEAVRLDARDAPQREIARQKKDADDVRTLQEKARLVNKPVFRP